ncbi:DUF4097 family beta strand repeat-containing protein [Clostridium sp. MD294]|uniref:DUF4097 family beta strand repeat-containing protein n=1 Tax=Clostridium sp. MD294 TaxID=97138 RepID=UPI0002CB9EE6|nr:DUF4097 family beta strand repeat-containing protein [Clostridium sp. MD294]NDO47524.1 DUF4097 family beta strand repeat protein [Clostridium sp. MD294]USF29404.1 hypothetical protein C820_000795 [Clostridium sp. MD294]
MRKKIVSLLLILCCSTAWSFCAYSQTETISKQQKTVTVTQMTLSQKEFDNIDKIQIIWARGNVVVTQSPDENVHITEKAFVMPKETEVAGISIKNDTLFIKDYNSLSSLSAQNNMNIDSKEIQQLLQQYHNTEHDLYIALPQKQYKEFYFKTVNANCNLENNDFYTIITETVNGEIQLNNVNANFINSNTVNGNILLCSDTNAQKYHLKCVNGNINADFTVFPTALSIETVNGNITLTLPENDGFSFYKNKVKTYNNFSTSFALKDNAQKKVYKNGNILLDIVCINGSVTLKKAETNSF